MILASAPSAPRAGEGIDKPKTATAGDPGETGLNADRQRQIKPLQQADLRGFIGADLWMVGKYER
jgi:hypothetical protein